MTGHADAMKHVRRTVTVGGRTVHACSDGMFLMPETFLGDRGAHAALAGPDGQLPLPIGCLLVPGETTVLIDAGMGPADDAGILIGGALLEHLAALGVAPEDIDVLAFTHLHIDHVGWVATAQGDPVFANAQVLAARADWSVFLERAGTVRLHMEPHVETALRALAERGRLTLMDGEHPVAPGIRAVPAAGHTPGHHVYEVQGDGDRLVWLGDVVYVPRQATEPAWRAASDYDPELALQARQGLWRDLEQRGGLALASHFEGLCPGRVVEGEWRPQGSS